MGRGMQSLKWLLIAAVAGVIGCGYLPPCMGQEAQATSAVKPDVSGGSKIPVNPKGEPRKDEHRFWDKENDWLFAGVGASRALDYSSTLNMRRRGNQEILLTNDVVDDHAGFAAIEAAGTGISIGASFLFHRYGHHKLERWTSIVHIGVTTFGGVRNYCLKTAHPVLSPTSPG